MAVKKVLDEQTLQTLLQLIAVEIKKKADSGHTHSQYVTTTALNSALDGINSFEVEIVNELPMYNANAHTIYLKPKSGSDSDDVYDEYMYIGEKWEHIGHTKIDLTDYATIEYVDAEIDKLATSEHTHEIADVTGLQTALNNKSDNGHTHSYNDLTNKPTIPTKVSELTNDKKYQTETEVTNAIANAVTGGTIDLSAYATVEAMNTGLAGKANTSHKHAMADVTGLLDDLASRATKTEVTQGLAGKSDTGHTHAISEINNLSTTLNDYSKVGHTHEITNINGLRAELDAKLNSADLTYLTSTEVTTMWEEANAE